ncbi:MAG TPA: hypothetical protein DIU10_18405, partial [Sulfitobacter sp.]|nr:hypothetical protein [Sulfitobacter sp.]
MFRGQARSKTPNVNENSPIIMWFRRDLRLSDQPALAAACKSGRPVIPLFIHDDQSEALG